MQGAAQILVVVAGILAVSTIALYATWLLLHRLRRHERKAPAFGEWLRNLFEAVWGL